MRLGLSTILLFPLLFPTAAIANVAQTVIQFPYVSTVLDEAEQSKIDDLVKGGGAGHRCYQVEAYFSPAPGYWTYRIIGRSRVLEIYRQLVLDGVKPEQISIRSLGPLNEQREYHGTPRGIEVKVSSHQQDAGPCNSSSVNTSTANEDRLSSMFLDYEVLDADPSQESLQRFLGQVQQYKDRDSQLRIETYSDMTGSHYLNLVLSRLRALVLFRQATLHGYPAEKITLQWNGRVRADEKGLPEPVVAVQRRSVVHFTESTTEVPAVAEPAAEQAVEPTPPPAPESAPERESKPLLYELALFGGVSSGPSSLREHVKPGWAAGLRLALFPTNPDPDRLGGEIQLSRDSFKAKSSMLEGGHYIDALTLAGLYIGTPDLPLTFRLGLRWEKWTGDVEHRILQESREKSGSDIAAYGAVGYRLSTFSNQWLEPRLEIDYGLDQLQGLGTKALLEYGWQRGGK